MLLVGQRLEAGKGSVQLALTGQGDTQLVKARTEGGAAGVFAHDHLVGIPAHRFGGHDFVGFAVFEHAVLVNARLVGKGVGTDNGLVRLHRKAGDARHQARGAEDVRGVDASVHAEQVFTGFDRHDDLFQRSVASPLAEAVDGALNLTGTSDHGSQELATARPRSLWQCTENTALSAFGTRLRSWAIISAYWCGMA